MATRAPSARTGALACLLLAGLAACSNDVELPSNYHEGLLAAPEQVETTLADGSVTVTWQMASLRNVTGFVVSFTDTTGAEVTRLVDDPTAAAYTDSSLGPAAGARWIVRLWAVDASGFFGPRSAPDTLRVP